MSHQDTSNTTLSQRYNSTDVPDGAIIKAEVVIFEDGSVHAGGPCVVSYSEETIIQALKMGLEMFGYKVDMTRTERVNCKVVLTDVVDPAMSFIIGPPAVA